MNLPQFESREARDQYVNSLQHSTSQFEFNTRRHLYADVEELIAQGYLSIPIRVGETSLCLRSMLNSDARLITSRIGLHPSIRVWKEWAVSSTIWMVDGIDLTGERNAPCIARKFICQMPEVGLNKLFSAYNGLYNRVTRAVDRVEAFCYEDYSRILWKMHNRHVSSVNHVQQIWTYFNLEEDVREQWDREWSAARFVASAQNPKGVEQIVRRDQAAQSLRTEQRKRTILDMYQRATGQVVVDPTIYRQARTPEELSEEMRRWVDGEKDFHDQLVDAYKDAIRQKIHADRKSHEERMAQLQIPQGISGGILSSEESRQYLESKRPAQILPADTGADRLFDRYLEKPMSFGELAPNGTIVRVSDNTLQDKIEKNKVGVTYAPKPE